MRLKEKTDNKLKPRTMFTKRITLIILFFSLSQLFISCKKEIDIVKEPKKQNSIKKIEFTVNFPDTLYTNQVYDGEISYKSSLDTIITKFGDTNKNRYARFILTTTDNVNYDFTHLKGIVKDTFGALNNRKIPFYDIKFSKPGVYYIDGIINDMVVINLNKKDKAGDDLSRLIENEERVTHKVVVVGKK